MYGFTALKTNELVLCSPSAYIHLGFVETQTNANLLS